MTNRDPLSDDRLDPQVRAILDASPKLSSLDVSEMRRHSAESKTPWNEGADVGLFLRHGRLGERGGAAWIVEVPGAESSPIVHVHGGGWSIGSPETHLSLIAGLARSAGRPVWAPRPRQAPEHPYPAPLDDVIAALFSMPDSPVQASGDSAGANLVLAALLKARDGGAPLPVSAAVLFYGCYRRRFDTGSHVRFGEGCGLTTAKMRQFWEFYAPEGGKYADLTTCDFTGLPPIQLHLATCDPLADDTRWLHARLREDGVETELLEWPGMAHGFLHYASALPGARDALDAAAQFLGRHA